MKILSITSLLLILTGTQLPIFAQTPPTPTLTCTIEQPLDAPSGTPVVTYDVSNEGYLVMDVAIDTKGGGALASSGAVAVNPSGTLPPTYLVVSATNSAGTNVSVNARITGEIGGVGGYQLTFFLPEDSTTRTTKEQAFINNALVTDTGSPSMAAAWVRTNNAQALAVVDKIYTQSQVGAITINVKYVSTQSGLWNGTITNTPIVVNVENKGSILDSIH